MEISEGRAAVIVALVSGGVNILVLLLRVLFARLFNKKKEDAETDKIESESLFNEEKVADIRQDRYLEIVDKYQELIDRNIELSEKIESFRSDMGEIQDKYSEVVEENKKILAENQKILSENKILQNENKQMRIDIKVLKSENEEIRALLVQEKIEKERRAKGFRNSSDQL
jgi:hypothetical protein